MQRSPYFAPLSMTAFDGHPTHAPTGGPDRLERLLDKRQPLPGSQDYPTLSLIWNIDHALFTVADYPVLAGLANKQSTATRLDGRACRHL